MLSDPKVREGWARTRYQSDQALKSTVSSAPRATGPMLGCGPCEAQWGCLGRKVEPPLLLLSPPLPTLVLPSPTPLPATLTQLVKQGALLSRSPRPRGMGGALSLGHKTPTSPALGSGPRSPGGGARGAPEGGLQTGPESWPCPPSLGHHSGAH